METRAGDRARSLVFLTPIFALLLLGRSSFLDETNLEALWLLLCALSLGAIAGKTGLLRKTFSVDTATKISPYIVALILITIGAGVLRFWALNFGLPAKFHPDETPKINAIMRMVGSGNLNPQYFLHPTLLIYLTYFLNTIFHYFGMEGDFAMTARLAGRTVSAIAGTLSIPLLFVVGRRLYGPVAGIVAAAFLAVFPLHVTCSRYMKEDALMTFFLLGVVLAVTYAVQTKKIHFLYIAAAIAGLATGVKYSGALTATIVLGAPWLVSRSYLPDRKFLTNAILAVAVLTPLLFVITTPYSILDYDMFSTGFSNERNHMLKGHTVAISAWSQYWMYHFWRSYLPGVEPITGILGVFAAGFLLWRRKWEDVFIVGLILLFYLPAEWVKAKPAPQPERYILPCLPFVAIACGALVAALAQAQRSIMAPMVALAALGITATRSIELASEVKNDTRVRMASWMKDNLPPGAKVRIDWQPYEPEFVKGEFQLDSFPSGKMMKYLNPAELKKSGYDYLLMSSLVYNRFFAQPQLDPVRRAVIRRAFQTVPVLKEITPIHGTYGFHNPTVTLFSLKPAAFAKLDAELAAKAEGKAEKTSNEVMASFNWRELNP